MSRFSTLRHLSIGAVLAGSLMAGGIGAASAQDQAESPSHPSHIHAGTCDDLDPNPAMPLNNIVPIGQSDDDEASEPQGVLTASQILYAESDDGDQLTWDDMLATAHSINVHESDENIQTYIACGEIGGVVKDDKLVVALHPMNDSGYTGIAILEKDDDNIDVEVYLAAPPTTNEVTTPEATPSS